MGCTKLYEVPLTPRRGIRSRPSCAFLIRVRPDAAPQTVDAAKETINTAVLPHMPPTR